MRSIIYIDRNNLYFYGGNVHSPLSFPFAKEIVTDLEIINRPELSKQIAEWIKNHKIEASTCIILLASSLYFQKEITSNVPTDQQGEIKKTFIENVPFNETYIQEILVGKSILLVAINTDFVYAIRDIFYTCGFIIEAISPIAEVYGLQSVSSFSLQVAQEALKKISKDNGIPLHTFIEPSSTEGDILPKNQTNTRLYIMICIFAVLLSILGTLFYLRQKPKKVVRRPTTEVVVPTKNHFISPTIVISPVSSSEATLITEKDKLTIQVLNGSGIAGQADSIRQALLNEEFNNITTGNAGTIQSPRTLIIFKKRVDEKERNEITKVIEVFVSNYTVQEKEDAEYDIIITTSKNIATPTP